MSDRISRVEVRELTGGLTCQIGYHVWRLRDLTDGLTCQIGYHVWRLEN